MSNLKYTIKILNIRKLFVFTLLTTSYLLLATRASASEFSLGLYPPIFQIQATVPTIITRDLTVVNASEQPTEVNIIFKAFQQGPYSNGQVQYISDDNEIGPDKDIFQKIQLLDGDQPIQNTTLAPKEKKTFTLRVGLPKDEPPADYYFSVIFQSTKTPTLQTNGSSITAGIAANVLLSIGPTTRATGLLEEFSSPWFVETGPVPFTVLINNLSRQYVAPAGQIVIENMFSQIIGKVDLVSVNILGQSSRYIPSREGFIQFGHPIAMWNEKVLFGPYSAHLVVSLSPEGPIFRKTIYFFAMPVVYIISFFVAIIVLSIVVSRVKKRMKED